MKNLIAEVLSFVTEDYFTANEVEEINEAISWMAGMPSDWQPPFNTLVVLYNTVKESRQQVEQAGGDCKPLLQQCAQRLCDKLKQLELFQAGYAYDTALELSLQQYNLQQLINGMWDKALQNQSTDVVIINQLLESYSDKLAEATKAIDMAGLWYEAYWLPLLYCALRPVDNNWKLNGISNKLCQDLNESMSVHSLGGAESIIYHTLELLTYLPVKMDIAVDYSHSRDLTLYWVQWSDADERCWDQELSGYIHGEEPFNESWSNLLNINEDNLMGLLGIEVNDHAEE